MNAETHMRTHIHTLKYINIHCTTTSSIVIHMCFFSGMGTASWK